MIVIWQSENPNYRKYNTKFKLTDGYQSREIHGRVGFQELLDEEVPGLQETPTLDKYQILVVKAPTFTWEEIDAKLLPLLHQLNHSVGVTGEEVKYEGIKTSVPSQVKNYE